MNEIKFRIITLNWVKADYGNFPNKPGFYQIYGTSPIYGMDTLLYLGKSKNLKDRITQHFESTESFIGRQPNKSCRYALLSDNVIMLEETTLPKDSIDYSLNMIEETLIVMHKPTFNSARLVKLAPHLNAIYIQNHGERGMLNIETTNFYFKDNSLLKEVT